jgi:hypothetical protein
MLRLGITLLITGFIFLIIYGATIGPITDMTDMLVVEGTEIITTAENDNNMSTLLNFIPTLFGVLAILMFIGALIAFAANALRIEPKEERYD